MKKSNFAPVRKYPCKTLTSNTNNMKTKVILLGLAAMLSIAAKADINITKQAGWLESAYAEWSPADGYSDYNVYVRPAGGSYVVLDKPLVRKYATYYRADAPGLTAGQYQLKIVAVDTTGTEVATEYAETQTLTVAAHDRAGFAHFNYNAGVGAYNNDGTLKQGAKVIYVTKNTARTISTQVKTAANGSSTSCTGLQGIIAGYERGYDRTPIVFRIIGTINAADMDAFGSSAEGLQVKGRNADSELNITIEGVGNDAVIKGFGILVRNTKSLEIRNLGVMTGLDDGISLDTDNDHIWIHHIDVFYGPNKGGDQAKGDGAIDIKSDSKHVTVAYCHFWDTGKSTMCGMKSESGPNYITYHHNWFDHSDSRHARIRTMSVHMYNNYYDGIAKYGVGATTGSSVFMEANYFNNCPKPMLISKQGTDIHNGVGTSDEIKGTFSGEAGGIIKSFANVFVGSRTYAPYSATNTQHFDAYEATSRSEAVPSTVTTLLGGNTYNNFDTNSSLMYTYTPDAASNVPAIVTGNLGAGRCEHGDLQFTFTDADNASYSINRALESLVRNYTTTLLQVLGETTSSVEPTEPVDPVDPVDPTDPVNPGEDFNSESGYECHFTGGAPSNSFYTVQGNYSTSKGTFTVNGTTYSTCLKLESATSVTFTTTQPMTIFLGFGAAAATIKIDGVKYTANNYVVQTDIAAGSHTLTKADSNNLFYINMSPAEDGPNLPDVDPDDGNEDDNDDPVTPEDPDQANIVYDYAAHIGTTDFAGTTTTTTAKYNTNSTSADVIVFKNSTRSVNNGDTTYNYIRITPSEGGFLAGDTIKIAGFYNNKEIKNAAVEFKTALADTAAFYTTDNFINGQTASGAPAVQTYVLTAACNEMFIGRSGNTSTYILSLQVVRSSGNNGNDQTAVENSETAPKAIKVFRNGHLYIISDDKEYTISGLRVR